MNKFVVIETPNWLPQKDSVKMGDKDLIIDPQFNAANVHNHTLGEIVSIGHKCPSGLKEGDTAHFHYNAIDVNGLENQLGTGLFRINHDEILCVERDGKVLPIGEWVLCEPIVDETVKDGYKTSSAGIVTSVKPSAHNLQKAVVKITPCGCVAPGDVIYYEKHADFDNIDSRVQGKKYFYIRKEDIMAKE